MSSFETIRSARLRGRTTLLRPVTAEDAEAAFGMLAGREDVLRWLLWRGPRTVEELARGYRSWIRQLPGSPRSHRREFLFAVEDAVEARFLGTIGVEVSRDGRPAGLGYWIGQEHWGRGYGSEAIALASHFAFRHLGADSVLAWVFVGNEASRRVLEKNGFVLSAVVRDKLESDGTRRDEWSFLLQRDSWERAGGAGGRLAEEEVRHAPSAGGAMGGD